MDHPSWPCSGLPAVARATLRDSDVQGGVRLHSQLVMRARTSRSPRASSSP